MAAYPSTIEEDREIIAAGTNCEDCEYGPIYIGAVKLRLREKELLLATLDFLGEHERQTLDGLVPFQLDMKVIFTLINDCLFLQRKEREEADLREAEHKKFMEEV